MRMFHVEHLVGPSFLRTPWHSPRFLDVPRGTLWKHQPKWTPNLIPLQQNVL